MSSQLVRDVMTTSPVLVRPDQTVGEVAKLMREQDIGAVLVTDNAGTTGLVTDRDIVVRVLAEDGGPDTEVSAAATPAPLALRPEDPVEAAVETMRAHAVRRVPVVQDGQAVGIVSLGDLAQTRDPDSVLGAISSAEPTH